MDSPDTGSCLNSRDETTTLYSGLRWNTIKTIKGLVCLMLNEWTGTILLGVCLDLYGRR